MTMAGPGGIARTYASQPGADDDVQTATPIKHVIVFIGENHTFDNIFATYRPPKGKKVKATIAITAQLGRTRLRATTTFIVQG